MATQAKRSQPNSVAIAPLSGALGARVDGLDLREALDPAMVALLKKAFLRHHVLIFPGQDRMTPDQQIAFAAHWGEVHRMTATQKCLDGNPAVLLLDTQGERPYTDTWHADMTMEECPPLGAFLLAKVVPMGGDTIFANQYLAWEALSPGMQRMLDGMRAMHCADIVAGTGIYEPDQFPRNLQPVVRTHPESGRKALFVNPVYTTHFEGMTRVESRPLLEYLCNHAVQPNFTFRHRWTQGDLLMWDNRCLLHFGVADYGSQPRTLHRVMVQGDRPH